MALEFASAHIRVNAVALAVDNHLLKRNEVIEVLASFNGFHPLLRNGKPEAIANGNLYLASDSAS